MSQKLLSGSSHFYFLIGAKNFSFSTLENTFYRRSKAPNLLPFYIGGFKKVKFPSKMV